MKKTKQNTERNKSQYWLFTIYKQKPVGTRFVQMVSKNSRMGNSVGIGAYHLRLPRESGGRQNHGGGGRGGMQTVNTFSVWEDQNRLTIYIPTEISGFLW